MGLGQLELGTGLNKVEVSLRIIQQNQPPDTPYFLGFSGGKDSIVLYHLAQRAGVKFEACYSQTGIDPPELIHFIRNEYPAVAFIKPLMTMWAGVEKKGLPTRRRRWCCEYLKHHAGKGRIKLMGIRAGESDGRKRLGFISEFNGSLVVNPIFKWSDNDVWEYILENKLKYCELYDMGFKRIGCVLCPLARKTQRQMEAERYPKFVEAYKRASMRHTVKMGKDEISGREYFKWWLNL